jgi:hypothetical protein
VTTTNPERAYEDVLRSVGASLPRRDSVDARIVREVRLRTGSLIDSQQQVGGWPFLRSQPAPADTDNDGMPDSWERRHQLNPTNSADGAADRNGDGYTNLEEYLNGIG